MELLASATMQQYYCRHFLRRPYSLSGLFDLYNYIFPRVGHQICDSARAYPLISTLLSTIAVYSFTSSAAIGLVRLHLCEISCAISRLRIALLGKDDLKLYREG